MTGDDSRSSTWLSVVTGTPRFWIRCGRSRRSHSETRLGRVRPLLRDARAAGDAGGRRDGRRRCELRADRCRHRCWTTTWTTPAAACRRRRPLGSGPAAGAAAGQRGSGADPGAARGERGDRRRGKLPAARRRPAGGVARRRDISAFEAAPPPPGRPGLRHVRFACGRRRVSVKHPRVSSDRSCRSSERPIPSMYAAAAHRHLAGP